MNSLRRCLFARSLAILLVLPSAGACSDPGAQSHFPLIEPNSALHFFQEFVTDEGEMLGTAPALQWNWFVANIPWLDIPDKQMETTYYFRWYAFQKHIKKTSDGYLISEFLDDVPWAGKFNTIGAAAGHQIREARWLRDKEYVEDYTRFWLGPDGEPRRYSLWIADSVYQTFLVTGNREFAVKLLPDLKKNFEAWNATRQDKNGLYWQIDDRDGMEYSISGSGYRPSINSYMYGDAMAISRIAEAAGDTQTAHEYRNRSLALRTLVEQYLWKPQDQFYETASRSSLQQSSSVRELIGYIPWYFEMPGSDHASAWKFLFDPNGFQGRYGPTTAERRNPNFNHPEPHECLWNGPSWPFATTQTLVALANLLNNSQQDVMSSTDYFHLLEIYARSQNIHLPSGKTNPWIDEDLNADTGDWIARNILLRKQALPENRGRYYNHSGFADLIINGLIGLRPSQEDLVVLNPLTPEEWDYFAIDGVPYHGHQLTIFYDKTGARYHRGVGLQILCDGTLIAHSPKLKRLQIKLTAHDHAL